MPGFEVTLVEDGKRRVLPVILAADPSLTFASQAGAEAVSDAKAREWCAKNYPGWLVLK
jgi:hypothetical protein